MTHALEMVVNSTQMFTQTFAPCSLGLARFTNVIFMLMLPFIILQYQRRVKREDPQVSERDAHAL